MTPAQRTPRTWQWAVKTRDGEYLSLRCGRDYAREAAKYWFGKLVKVSITELPAARQRRGR